jgi:hypothetical protein
MFDVFCREPKVPAASMWMLGWIGGVKVFFTEQAEART